MHRDYILLIQNIKIKYTRQLVTNLFLRYTILIQTNNTTSNSLLNNDTTKITKKQVLLL